MTKTDHKESQDIIAIGLQGLKDALAYLFKLKEAGNTSQEYILYQVINPNTPDIQKALIKVDLREKPYQFWYADLLGRNAPQNVKRTIAEFLWENGEKQNYQKEPNETSLDDCLDKIIQKHFHDFHKVKLEEKVEGSLSNTVYDISIYHNLEYVRNQLNRAIANHAWEKVQYFIPVAPDVSLGSSSHTLFAPKSTEETPSPSKPTPAIKPK